MSEFHVTAVRLGPVEKHPDADTLAITKVHGGYPCIVRLGEYAEGDLATYIPVDSIVDTRRAEFAFLAKMAKSDGWARIKALRLRGVFSMGLLIPAPSGVEAGADLAEHFDVRKYEPPWETSSDGQDAPPPSPAPPVYDLEGLRRWSGVLKNGEEVCATEKLHGSSGRALVALDGSFHVSSHTKWKDPEGNSEWAVIAREFALKEKLDTPRGRGHCIYWECIGKVGGFPYGTLNGKISYRVFDVLRLESRTFLDADDAAIFCAEHILPMVPVLYRGPFIQSKLDELACGPSTLDEGHVREGIVVRPVKERFDMGCGRVVLKLHGEDYLTGKKLAKVAKRAHGKQ